MELMSDVIMIMVMLGSHIVTLVRWSIVEDHCPNSNIVRASVAYIRRSKRPHCVMCCYSKTDWLSKLFRNTGQHKTSWLCRELVFVPMPLCPEFFFVSRLHIRPWRSSRSARYRWASGFIALFLHRLTERTELFYYWQ